MNIKKSITMIACFALMTGCAGSNQNNSPASLTHNGYTYEKPGIPFDKQEKQFQLDSNECSDIVNDSYEKSVKQAETLSAIYGQKIDEKKLALVRDASFVICMTGIKGEKEGKGWIAKKS